MVRKYAFQWWGGFNLSPLIRYPLRAIIAVSKDDTCEFDKKNVAWENKLYVLFFIFFFLYTDFYDRQKYLGGGRHTCRPCSDAHAILRSFLKSYVMWTIHEVRWFTIAACNTDAGLRC